MAPSGVPILRPPANALPPGTEWQATQSPARATYSPLLSAAASAHSASASGAAAWHDVDVDLRRLGEAHHAVGVEIALLRHAVLDGDFSIKGGAEPEDRTAFHLLGDGERVHDILWIDGDRDAIHLKLAFGRDGDLRDMGAEASHVVADGDAAPLALWQRLAPVALLGDGVEHLEPVGLPA